MQPILILGSGLGGYSLAREVRKLDRTTPITLISRDAASFYAKPNLSNAFASKKFLNALQGISAEQMAADLSITVLPRSEVTQIDRARGVVVLRDSDLGYHSLVLATGADPIALPLEGNAAHVVMRVNDVEDYARFRQRLSLGGHSNRPKHVTILGAGLIGCEFANDLLAAGHRVTVLDPVLLPLGRLLPVQAGVLFRDRLAAAGVDWQLGHTLARLEHSGDRLLATHGDGRVHETDLVLSAVGLKPRTQLAAMAGLRLARGIVANEWLQTSDPHIYALGDCVEAGGQVLPYVLPIMQQARALAKTLTGTPTRLVYPAMPVMVKTPALPTVVAPPTGSGEWHIVNQSPDALEAEFMSPSGALNGFVLMGSSTRLRTAWTQRIAGNLPGNA